MNNTEIIVRAIDQNDAIVIGTAIKNGLAHFGFTNVSNSVAGSKDMDDPELMEMLGVINPELLDDPIDVSYEHTHPSGAVDAGDENIGFSEPDDDESDEDEDD